MTNKLSLGQIAVLAGYATGMAGGQLLFKRATLQLPGEVPLANRLFSLLHNGFFLGAVALYAALSRSPSHLRRYSARSSSPNRSRSGRLSDSPGSWADFTSSPGERT